MRGQSNVFGQLGHVLFMVLIGLELNPKLLQGRLPLASRITAFPVLARILRERNLLSQPLGALVITAAAIGDEVSWVLLAIAVATSRSTPGWGCT